MANNKNERKISKRVINKKESKPAKDKPKKPSSGGYYYSFLTIILLLCLVQITISAVLNVSKVISYRAKILQITKTRDAAMSLNEQLKENVKNFSNATGLEAIARNNLKMSSEDEVLVIINTQKEEKKEKPKKMGFMKND